MDECKPLVHGGQDVRRRRRKLRPHQEATRLARQGGRRHHHAVRRRGQGLTLVRFSDQRKHDLWDMFGA